MIGSMSKNSTNRKSLSLRTIISGFRSKRSSLWAWRLICLFVVVALLSPIISNELPIIAKIEGEWSSPSLSSALNNAVNNKKIYSTSSYDRALYPPITYSAGTIDSRNRNYVSPMDDQVLEGIGQRHWLGTDELGRDTLAGLLGGLRIALIVGFFSMTLAMIFGTMVGMISGYFGDDVLRLSLIEVLIYIIMTMMSLYLIVYFGDLLRFILWMLLTLTLVFLVNKAFNSLDVGRNVKVSLDLIIQRVIEIFESIPGLFMVLALISIFPKPSIWNVILVIGIIKWPSFARLIRAEVLRLREEKFVLAAKALGTESWMVMKRHLLPNAIAPLIVIFTLGIGSAVLIESTLSFLGIGVSAETVTWGSMLSEARQHFSAWWLVIFPGLGIFTMVICCNILGKRLEEILDRKIRN